MKIFLSLVIITASTFVGYTIRKNYQEKNKFFLDLLHFIELLKIDISFFQNTVGYSISKYKNEVSGLCRKMLEQYIKYLDNNEYPRDLNNFVSLDFLPDNQAETIKQLLLFIGSSDSSSQCEMLENYKQIFTQYSQESSSKLKKYGNFALKMSLSIGLVVVILAI